MPLGHLDQIDRVLNGSRDGDGLEFEGVAPSWRRSASFYRVDAASAAAPRILTAGEIGESRGPLDELIHVSQGELDRLYQLVGKAGYTVLLCDIAGAAIDHRLDAQEESQFRPWGVCLGGIWSEAAEGTNGIGTCIAEERPVTIHRGQHFRSRHIDLSCSSAPIFGIDGTMLAVLDVSAIDPQRSEHAHALTGLLTNLAAQQIEEQFFRTIFRGKWIVATASAEDAANYLLFALDADLRIVGANRAARATFGIDDGDLHAGISLGRLFQFDGSLFCRRTAADTPALLTVASSGNSWPALLTPPDDVVGLSQSSAAFSLRRQSRRDLVARLRMPPPVEPTRGGLTPSTMRRIEEFVEAHLGDSNDIATLAALAKLSVFHFARQFKHSTGMTPHGYLLKKRLEKAKELLTSSALPIAEIAVVTGFSDQSHFTRRFGEMFGVTPAQFRNAPR